MRRRTFYLKKRHLETHRIQITTYLLISYPKCWEEKMVSYTELIHENSTYLQKHLLQNSTYPQEKAKTLNFTDQVPSFWIIFFGQVTFGKETYKNKSPRSVRSRKRG